MNIFKIRSTAWWELGLLKFAALCFGLAIGANWPDIFGPYQLALLIAGAATGAYVLYAWLRT